MKKLITTVLAAVFLSATTATAEPTEVQWNQASLIEYVQSSNDFSEEAKDKMLTKIENMSSEDLNDLKVKAQVMAEQQGELAYRFDRIAETAIVGSVIVTLALIYAISN